MTLGTKVGNSRRCLLFMTDRQTHIHFFVTNEGVPTDLVDIKIFKLLITLISSVFAAYIQE